MERNLTQRLLGVKMVVLDVDGVLTDGRIMKTESGGEILAFDVKDGMGISRLKKAGIEVAILSARSSGAVVARAKELGIERVYLGQKEKGPSVEYLAGEANIDMDSVAYVGDDLADIEAMRKVGLPVAVADAAPEVKEQAVMVLDASGGRGAVRELAEAILRCMNKWP